ncbi:MAG: hypothetical protein ACJA1B_001100 [Polaribacter sp.]|jgi:hypothetical protein
MGEKKKNYYCIIGLQMVVVLLLHSLEPADFYF